MPYVWDRSHAYAYGVPDPTAAPRDMPRASGDPSKTGTVLATIIDVSTAVARTHMPPEEREALRLRYARDLIPVEIAQIQQAPRRTIVSRLERAVGRLVDYLNGPY
ncbi:hypothetical protein Afil01_62430 [Actinorhabdospora filicis]|uniref:RNA polymerase sigma-70 region 4 domain-containing protein n=1 Tax=Actinorhabdospora filicis TaxID=1785913 RepID=A0A9W6SS61_9ACTN|nr:hypothetical protein [Actinorhabdospora filicis]GLZ81436.1 hypothetical protein Afil01_62430 [Actinorhabdospora filicis]